MHFKEQLRLLRAESQLNMTRGQLYESQGEFASGAIVEFKVPRHLIGFVIGKKGARLELVKNEVDTLILLKHLFVFSI